MKRFLAMLLSAAVILAMLCSCSVIKNVDLGKEIKDKIKDKISVDAEDLKDKVEDYTDDVITHPIKKLNILETRYFNIEIPESWIGNYHVEMTEGSGYDETGEFLYTVCFYDKKGYEREMGHLVDIILTSDPDFQGFANGEKFGEMAADRTYYFFARYPSDVQFDLDNRKIYEEMRDDVDDLLEGISSDKYTITIYDRDEEEQNTPSVSPTSDFIFPESSVRQLTEAEISARLSTFTGYSPSGSYKQDAINEIYARNGYVFKTASIQSYYEAKPWYTPNPAFTGQFNATENYNISLLKKF